MLEEPQPVHTNHAPRAAIVTRAPQILIRIRNLLGRAPNDARQSALLLICSSQSDPSFYDGVRTSIPRFLFRHIIETT
jgi:hypothetical protein